MLQGELAADPGADAIFPVVLGCVRSGTTMLRAVLDSHPSLAVPPESYFVAPALVYRSRYERGTAPTAARPGPAAGRHRRGPRRSRTGSSAPPPWPRSGALRVARPCPDALLALYRAYAHQQGKPRAATRPRPTSCTSSCSPASFPQARFVHIVRDGRDVVPSILEMSLRPGPVRRGGALLARPGGAGAGRRCRARARAVPGDPVRGPGRRPRDRAARRLPVLRSRVLDPRCSVPRARRRPARRDARSRSHVQGVRRPPTRGVRDWRTDLATHDVQLFEALAGDLLDELGYERSGLPIPSRVRVEAHAIRLAGTGSSAARCVLRTRIAPEADPSGPAAGSRRGPV